MTRDRLNESHREILKIYQDASKRKKSEKFNLTRKEISNLLFRKSGMSKSPSWKLPLLGKGGEAEKDFKEKQLPYKLETERQAWTRRTEDQKRTTEDMNDWRERVGLKTGLRGIYSKKQEILRRSLKDLVRKGYLESSGSGLSSSYKSTEKTFKAKIPRF